MPFEKIPGLPGLVYVPEQHPDLPKKNSCPDCFFCQVCSEDRCQMCLRTKTVSNNRCCCEKGENCENSGDV